MDAIREFFHTMPQALPLYLQFQQIVLSECKDVQITIQKTQIVFAKKHQFAFVWLPVRNVKNRPDVYIIITFGLSYQLDSPRIIEATEPYPNRWTHHVIIQQQTDIDRELINWVKQAYHFADMKW